MCGNFSFLGCYDYFVDRLCNELQRITREFVMGLLRTLTQESFQMVEGVTLNAIISGVEIVSM